jgi:hypothetical protein
MAGDMRRETVVVVHGTFDAPEVGLLKWYQPNGSFCKALDRALEQSGSNARCWAHLADSTDPIFWWDGGNSYQSRYDAAAAFNEYYQKLHDSGWKCHVVAHSHGGNVVIRGLYQEIERHLKGWGAVPIDMTVEEARESGETDYWNRERGEMVCLGTPFLDIDQFQHIWIGPTKSQERHNAASTLVAAALGIGLCVCLAFVCRMPLVWLVLALMTLWCLYQGYRAIVLVLSGHILTTHYHERESPRVEQDNLLTFFVTHCLCLTSIHDEAWVLLRGFREWRLKIFDHNTANAVGGNRAKRSWFRRCLPILFELVVLSLAVLLWLAAGPLWSFLLLMAYAFLLVINLNRDEGLRKLQAIYWDPVVAAITAFVVRQWAAPLLYARLRANAYGLEDLPWSAAEVSIERRPSWHVAAFARVEALPDDVVEEWLSKRGTWADRAFASMADIRFGSAAVRNHLIELAVNRSLVHSSYYEDERIVERIAKFIHCRQ